MKFFCLRAEPEPAGTGDYAPKNRSILKNLISIKIAIVSCIHSTRITVCVTDP